MLILCAGFLRQTFLLKGLESFLNRMLIDKAEIERVKRANELVGFNSQPRRRSQVRGHHGRDRDPLETLEQKTLCERVKFLRGKFSVAAPALHGFRSFVEMKAQSLIPWRFSRDDL